MKLKEKIIFLMKKKIIIKDLYLLDYDEFTEKESYDKIFIEYHNKN